MKRSEMVNQLEAKLLASLGYSFTKEEISQILIQVEQAGMCPPAFWVSNGCLHTMREPCDCPSGYFNGWEKE